MPFRFGCHGNERGLCASKAGVIHATLLYLDYTVITQAHNHTHTYTIIHADAREDMHTYNRTILGGQVRKSLVLWGAIQIRM